MKSQTYSIRFQNKYFIDHFTREVISCITSPARVPEITHFIAVAPPVEDYDFSFVSSSCPVTGTIIQGTNDQVASPDHVFELYNKVSRQRNSDVIYNPITEADHYFMNHLDALEERMHEYIKPRLDIQPTLGRSKWDRKKK